MILSNVKSNFVFHLIFTHNITSNNFSQRVGRHCCRRTSIDSHTNFTRDHYEGFSL